jgi:diguanylate cyclase (GGDEF)-like protein/PAS domain S-box-containing protein
MADMADHLACLSARTAALEAELALYHDVVESMHQGLCVFGPDGRITLVNDRYTEQLRLPPGAVQPGLTGQDIVRLCVEAGHYPSKSRKQVSEQIRDQFRAHVDSGPSLGKVVRGDKTYQLKQARTPDGSLVVTCEDISAQVAAEGALHQSEARLRAILDAMPDCVKIFAASGDLIHINPKGLELLEASSMEALLAPGFEPIPTEYIPLVIDVHRRVMGGETVVWSYELVGLGGTRRHVEAHSVPFAMPDGSSVHMSITRDITARHEAHDALRRSEERLRLVQEATGLADFEAGPDGVAHFSGQFVEQTGLPHDTTAISHADWFALVYPDDRERLQRLIKASLDQGESFDCEFRINRADTGEIRWISSRTKVERDKSGRSIRSIGAHLDITDRKRGEEALRESEERFRLAAEAAGLGVWDYDLTLDRREWSDRLREIFGISAETEASLEVAESGIHPADRSRFMRTLRNARATDVGRFEASFRIRRANDGAERWITINGWRTQRADTEQRRIIMTVRDVTQEKTAEERVRWAASHDALTRLANRSLFQEKLDVAIDRASESGGSAGLLLLDLDHFKQINDSLGHDVGDMLLKNFAERLRRVVRPSDTVARLGGDEFAVVLPDLDGEHTLHQVARSIQDRLREPFIHTGRILDCRVSIGASLFPIHCSTSEEMLKNADIALYAAKAAGRGIVTRFEPHMRDDVQRRNSMVQLARNALGDDRIVPYYQPKLDLANRTLAGFEALLRWRTPRGRIGTPASLEAAFEDSEVAAQISDRMIDRVITDMRGWLDRGVDFGSVAVNASAAEFRRDNFAERVLEQLRRADIPTRCFQLEITETVFLGRGAEYVHRALALLNMRGVKIALDDFGTGYASLRHLKQFPVDILKIDQGFVRDMTLDPGDEAIIHAVINLGDSLGIKIVAEGIETIEQERRLVELGCNFGQGFLFSRAVSAKRVPALTERWRRPEERVRCRKDLRLVASCN